MIAKVLALVGPAAEPIRCMAHAAAFGLLPLTLDTEAAILKACSDIAEIKSPLMKSLGVREK